MSSSFNILPNNNRETSTLVLTTSNQNETTDVCAETSATTYQIFWIIIIVVILLLNTFILAAMAKGWSILRQHIVHRYLISCLLSVMSFCLVSAYEMLHTIYGVDQYTLGETVLQRYDRSNPVHRTVMQRYAYRKGLLPVLAIVMQFNIAVLIYGVSDNTHFVGRFTNPEMLSKTQFDSRAKNSRKKALLLNLKKWRAQKPFFMCSIAWIAPLGISVPVAFGWSCVEHCICLPAYRWGSTCIPRDGSSVNICSRTWLPISRSYVMVITSLFFVSMAMIFWLLIATVRKFQKTHSPKKSTKYFKNTFRQNISPPPINLFEQRSSINPPGLISENGNFEWKTRSFRVTSSKQPVKLTRSASLQDLEPYQATPKNSIEIEAANTMKPDVSKRQLSRSSSFIYRRKRPPLDPTVKLLIVLTISLFLSVTPVMMIWFLDVVTQTDVSKGYGFSVTLSLSYIYAASLPLMLLKYMSGLKQACISFFIKCPCTGTTVVTQTTGLTASRPSPQGVANHVQSNDETNGESNIFSLNPDENMNDVAK